MTRISLAARRGLRSKRAIGHLPAADMQIITTPASQSEREAHIWAVNAAVEAGQEGLAHELADRYLQA